MTPAATNYELQLIESVYYDVEHGRLDAAVAKMREHYAEANAPRGVEGEAVTLQQAIDHLESAAECACGVTTAIHFHGERRLELARDIRIVLGELRGRTAPSRRIDESQRQLVIIALAKLTFTRPGWATALRDVAAVIHGEVMFDKVVRLGPDVQAIVT